MAKKAVCDVCGKVLISSRDMIDGSVYLPGFHDVYGNVHQVQIKFDKDSKISYEASNLYAAPDLCRKCLSIKMISIVNKLAPVDQ